MVSAPTVTMGKITLLNTYQVKRYLLALGMIPRLTADNMTKKSTCIMLSGRQKLPEDTSQCTKTRCPVIASTYNNILFVPKQITAQNASTSYY